MLKIETKTQIRSVCRRPLIYLAIACPLALVAPAYASADTADSGDAYVDSVYSWGTWELGLEPASGPQTPVGNTLNNRSMSLKFRPNDNAAFMARSVPLAKNVTLAPSPPMPVPQSTPAAPTLPVGPPGFSSGAPTTLDPRN